MRLLSIITAIIVSSVLYIVVFERDRLVSFAGSFGTQAAPEEPEATDETEPEVVAEAPVEEIRRVSVVTQTSEAQVVDSAVLMRGQTQAARQVDVRSETSGLVISTPLRKGAYVETGQLLCEIDEGTRRAAWAEADARLSEAKARLPEARNRLPEAMARVAEAEARLEEARINDRAARQLSTDGFASQTRVAGTKAALSSAQAALTAAQTGVETAKTAVQSTEASIASAEAAVASAEKEIERLQIRAPFAGYLESDTAELGSLLQPGALCATVLQLNPMKLVGFVPETEVSRVEVGAPAGARLTSGDQISGAVTFLARSSDMETRTFRVEIEVDNSDLTIRDGQTAEILVSAPGEKAHLIPQSAMTLDDGGRLGVRYAEDGVAHFSAINVVRDTREGAWVTGLPDTVDIIVVGQEFVKEGVPVIATNRADLQEVSQ